MRYLAVAAILITIVPVASADQELARKAYDKGMTAYNLQDYGAALDMFKRAYEEQHDPAFLFNIGQCQRQLGQYDAAAKSYRAYLNTSTETPPNTEQVRKLIANMEQAEQIERAKQPPAGVAGPTTEAVNTPVVVATAPAPKRPWYKNGTGWALLGSGVAVGAVAAGMFGAALSEHNAATSASAAGNQKSFDDHHSNTNTFQDVGIVTGVVGGGLAIAGIVVLAHGSAR